MGFLSSVVEFLRTSDQGTPTPEVKCDSGDGDPVTAGHFAPPGVDARPLPGDVAYLGDDLGAGNAQAVGYQDPTNAGVAGAGEHRIYSRAGDGSIVAELWLKADGSILVHSLLAGSTAELAADGSISLATPQASATFGADGAIDVSNALGGVAIDASGNVVATTPLGTFGAGTHMHLSPFGPTGAPIPGT
jgi:hypothetical protein